MDSSTVSDTPALPRMVGWSIGLWGSGKLSGSGPVPLSVGGAEQGPVSSERWQSRRPVGTARTLQ